MLYNIFFALIFAPCFCFGVNNAPQPPVGETAPLYPQEEEEEEEVADRKENVYEYNLYDRQKDERGQNQYYYYQNNDSRSQNNNKSRQYFNPRRDD